MIKKIISKIIYTLLFFVLSHGVYAQDSIAVKQVEIPLYDKEIKQAFNTITQRQKAGSVVIIDVQQELKRDQVNSVGEAINGKVPGVFGGTNIWGNGGATILVDGVRQSSFYINSMNMLEVDSIVIYKDALSTSMFGAQADNGIIVVTTNRGKAGTHEVRVSAQYRYSEPRALPNYLNAADYMSRFNEALFNDGQYADPDDFVPRYSQEAINATRSGENPARYPDNDFYSDRYIKESTRDINIFADVRGGSENVRYYANTEWTNNNGWLNTPQSDNTNRLNFRGNLDFKVNDYIEMSVNTTGRFQFNTRPQANSIWGFASNELPNNYPVLWDPNLINDDVLRESILGRAKLVDGQLLGGNSTFLDNVYGEFTRNGKRKLMDREVQFGIKLDIDLRGITPGLSGKFYGGMNFFNSIFTRQDPQYKVYQPIFSAEGNVVDVSEFNQDVEANRFNIDENNSEFFRQTTYYGTLNYDRTFGKHAISATGLVNTDIVSVEENLQNQVFFNTALTTNYMFDKKYIVELSLVGVGSRRLSENKRIEPAFSAGSAWVISEENFMPKTSFIDYLKIRTSYGVSKNDNWTNFQDDYFLYKNTFRQGGSLTYFNGAGRNNETTLTTAANDIVLQKRRDFTLGMDGLFFDKAMSLQLGYFNSESLDNLTQMNFSTPELLGYDNRIIENFNSTQTQGIELGLSYQFKPTSDVTMTVGGNMLYINPQWTKREEPFYQGVDRALLREGTASDAVWGLKSDGLYAENDFTRSINGNLVLVDGLPKPDFGDIQPGDIKYLDQNDDGIINNLDQRIIGHGLRTQYSLYVDFHFQNFEFYMLGIGTSGDSNFRSGSYFRVDGNSKYSNQANLAYGPNNKNVNALHPRLSTNNIDNNNRDSDFWIFKNDTFTIPTMQLTYKFEGLKETSALRNSRVFVRANNVLILGANKEYTEISIGGAPRTSSLTLGLVASF
ncbi:hypothetical protein BST83_11565 [Polaribacter filamentus]|jgi:TonB-linked SusC/RagA family outer membrane protein|uniref:TonB-dependent receptor plug domain-containing protein n=1 Tax=Polaribacter filamentus TaxID=53483 RepID=A0A2S7KYZ4_9FLAO|nr:TonB-dependent receptor plug domain-containing protein [Polaribacter filamentus]PQB07723.1 hypothetical protein BST83_11565 [Polaribacter filamentus]